MVGRSAVVTVSNPIARVSLTSPDIADALVTTSHQLLVHGKTPGTISMFVWDRAGAIRRYEVIVKRDLSQLVAQIAQLFPGEQISVASNGKDVVIAGTVSSKYVVEKAAAVASGYVESKEDVVNLLRQQEGIASNQVLLRVRFAEINRSAMTELGVSLFSDGYEKKFGSTSTQQFPSPIFDQANPMVNKSLIFSDYLNLFFFDQVNQLGAVVKALQAKGLFQMLAEPNLIAENGKEASFLAGGEYPVPGRPGNGRQSVHHDCVQGVRHSAAVHADGARWRSDSPQGGARGQFARLRERGRGERIPDSRAFDPPGRDRGRAERRTDVRHCRPDEQHRGLIASEGARNRRHPRARTVVSQQGREEGTK